jgi:hypothetical protein
MVIYFGILTLENVGTVVIYHGIFITLALGSMLQNFFTLLVYCSSTVITAVLLFYNTEGQEYRELVT